MNGESSPAVAVIPARAGSKGIPHKNLRIVGGVTLVGRAIMACRAAESVGEVLVSTDSQEIAVEAEKHGATAIKRPQHLAGDHSSSESAVLHALGDHFDEKTPAPKVTLLVQCTSPFVTADQIDSVASLVLSEEFDSAFAAAPFHRFVWRSTEDGTVHALNHDASTRLRRQDWQPDYLEAGSVFAMATEQFLEEEHRFFGRVGVVAVDSQSAMEIDDFSDLRIAELLAHEPTIRSRTVSARLQTTRAVALDFDGVLTDNTSLLSQTGNESVRVNRSDGLGIALLLEARYVVCVISSEKNPVVETRCRKLGIPCIQGSEDKGRDLQRWLAEVDVQPEHCLFVGNDVNDLPAMALVGASACPSDADGEVIRRVDFVLASRGGDGVAREVATLLLQRDDCPIEQVATPTRQASNLPRDAS